MNMLSRLATTLSHTLPRTPQEIKLLSRNSPHLSYVCPHPLLTNSQLFALVAHK